MKKIVDAIESRTAYMIYGIIIGMMPLIIILMKVWAATKDRVIMEYSF